MGKSIQPRKLRELLLTMWSQRDNWSDDFVDHVDAVAKIWECFGGAGGSSTFTEGPGANVQAIAEIQGFLQAASAAHVRPGDVLSFGWHDGAKGLIGYACGPYYRVLAVTADPKRSVLVAAHPKDRDKAYLYPLKRKPRGL